MIYNAKVTATLLPPRPTIANPSPPPTTKEERYTGLTINTAKKMITGHNGNFNNREQKETTFSAHIWEVKDKGEGSLFFPKLAYFLTQSSGF